jgi:hypothetical protein
MPGEPLDVAFSLSQEQLASAGEAQRGSFAPADRVGEVLEVVASALREIPFGAVSGIGIREITGLRVESDAPLEAPITGRARAVDSRELAAGRHLVLLDCALANGSGEPVASFSVATEATAEVPVVASGISSADSIAASEPECVDNIPV